MKDKILYFRKRYRETSPAARSSFWFTICNFLQRGVSVITVPIFTRLLTTEEYGVCNVYFTWFEILVLLTSLKMPYEGLNNGLIRFESERDAYASSTAGLILTLTLVWTVFMGIFQRQLCAWTGLSLTLIRLMMLQLLFNPALYLWMNREKFEFRYRKPVLVTFAMTVLNPVLSVALVFGTKYKAEARVMGVVLVQAVFGLVCYFLLLRRGRRFYDRTFWQFGLSFHLPLIFYYLSQTVLNQSDRLMIDAYFGSGRAGIYSVAYSAATLVYLLVSAVNGAFTPWMYRKWKKGEREEIPRVVWAVSLLVAGLTVGMMAFAPDLIALLATEKYQEAVWIVPPVAAGVFFLYLYMLFVSIELYYGENQKTAGISVIGAAANVAGNAALFPVFGYLAAGWTTLASYLLLAVLHAGMMKRACRRHGLTEKVLPERELKILSVLVAGGALVMVWVYSLGALRYLVILAAGAALGISRKHWIFVLRALVRKDTKEEE